MNDEARYISPYQSIEKIWLAHLALIVSSSTIRVLSWRGVFSHSSLEPELEVQETVRSLPSGLTVSTGTASFPGDDLGFPASEWVDCSCLPGEPPSAWTRESEDRSCALTFMALSANGGNASGK